MIIKSHVRGGYRAAATYLSSQGKNEKIRLVEISDPDAANLHEAFQNMWRITKNAMKTPLHHISINPYADERLTKAQLMKIIERCEDKYGYKHGDHQRVIVEHVKNGRQHFHVMWNRVSLTSRRAVWPGQHWKKSKQAAREMETELGFKRPMPKKVKRAFATSRGRVARSTGRYRTLTPKLVLPRPIRPAFHILTAKQLFQPAAWLAARRRPKRGMNEPIQNNWNRVKGREELLAELLAWAWEQKRLDILYSFGIILPEDYFDI
ncbi:MAG: relaxase/mobilization nuclease domain-containing protein [Negativicutes bacterium]|nr:relaxase/mobilization nuclease domain-containing protein [Negativicutes bacterium]